MPLSRTALTVPLAAAALAVFGSARAEAQDYDMDCKLLICLPGGFPSGCGDAWDHMIDRLRDGKSPIGTCNTGSGPYEDYEIDYDLHSATSPAGWQCPEGASLYHEVSQDGRHRTVSVFCYENRDTVRFGSDYSYYYTGRSRPERIGMSFDMTFQPDADEPYRIERVAVPGVGFDRRVDIHYGE